MELRLPQGLPSCWWPHVLAFISQLCWLWSHVLLRNLQLPAECSPSTYLQPSLEGVAHVLAPTAPALCDGVLLLQEAQRACAGGHLADQADWGLLLSPVAPGMEVLPWRRRGFLPLCHTLLDGSLMSMSLNPTVWQSVPAWFVLTAVSLFQAQMCPRGWAVWFESHNSSRLDSIFLLSDEWGFDIKSSLCPQGCFSQDLLSPRTQTVIRSCHLLWVQCLSLLLRPYLKGSDMPLEVIRHYLQNKITW